MASLPSFVELLSSLGMSDRPAGTVDPKPSHSPDRVHDPRDVPQSGRHVSPTMAKKARFSPYSANQALALSDRRGSLPALPASNLLDCQPSRSRSTLSSSSRRSSLPALFESSNKLPSSSNRPRKRQSVPRLSIHTERSESHASAPISTLLRKSPTTATAPHIHAPRPRSPAPLAPMSLPTLPLVPYRPSPPRKFRDVPRALTFRPLSPESQSHSHSRDGRFVPNALLRTQLQAYSFAGKSRTMTPALVVHGAA